MEPFKSLDIPIILDTSSNNLVEDFFKPVLTTAIRYDRGVGYFTSGWLRINSIGLSKFAENGGYARWITSPILSKEDWEALLSGEQAREDIISKTLLQQNIPDLKEGLEKNTLSTLSWLIADEILNFKIALPHNLLEHGEFHDKFGIFYDAYGDSISFSGSYNDSIKGMINYESIKVFKSWLPEFTSLVNSEQERFNNLWENKDPNLQVFDLPTAAKEEIIKFRSGSRPYKPSKSSGPNVFNIKITKPKLPEYIELRDYQKDAIQAWIDNDYQGIFEMATGTGKTITALAASIYLFNELSHLAIIIACPLQHLVVQWNKEAEKFGYFPKNAFDSKLKWFDEINNKIMAFNHRDMDNLCITTTYDTFVSDSFQETMNRIDGPLLLIGDEVHHLGSEKRQSQLPDHVGFRLGLSATPTRWYDEKGTQRILNYFGDIIFEFPLSNAISEGYLTPYYYYPKLVELSEVEIIQYDLLSKKIGRLIGMGEDPEENENLLRLLIKRAEILQTAENKIPSICEIVDSIPELSHALFYCAPKQVEDLTRRLGINKHLRVHRFTYQENHVLRRKLLENFDQGILQALIAIKCLDEGVDIPSTKIAFFLSSSSNPREFVQRRGRILRNHPGKKSAEIYDLIAVPPVSYILDSNIERNILRRELLRFKEFAENSLNHNSAYEEIWELSKTFGIFDL